MPHYDEAPADKAGTTCDMLAGGSRFPFTLEGYQAQFLTAAYAVRPEMAAMVAALAFGGGGCHG